MRQAPAKRPLRGRGGAATADNSGRQRAERERRSELAQNERAGNPFDLCGQISVDEVRAFVGRALNSVVALVCLMERAFRGADLSTAVRGAQTRAARDTRGQKTA
jgi:hypothetical protein